MSFFSTILIFLSSFLRVMITFDTFNKEEKVMLSYQNMSDKYGQDAQTDADKH